MCWLCNDIIVFVCRAQEVRPTVFVGVPRVWEKFKEIMERVIKDTSGIKEVVLQKARVSGLCGWGECEV